MGRSPQEIFTAHLAAVASGDPDAVTGALAAVPAAKFSMGATVFSADAALVTWSATSAAARVTGAVDTFVFDGDRIRLQTAVFSMELSAP